MNILLLVCPPFEGYADLMKIVRKLHDTDEGDITALCLTSEIAMKYYSPFSIQLEGKKNREKEKMAMDYVTETLGENRVQKMNRGGEPVSQLVGFLDENKYDLLIFSDTDKRITQKIAEHSTIPTLIYRGGKSLDNILLCSDGSEFSLQAAVFTAKLANILGGQITLLTVFRKEEEELQSQWFTNATKFVLEQSGIPPKGIKVETAMGKAVETILEKEKDYDIVVLGSRGLHRIARALIGHVSLNVVKKANKSILLVK